VWPDHVLLLLLLLYGQGVRPDHVLLLLLLLYGQGMWPDHVVWEEDVGQNARCPAIWAHTRYAFLTNMQKRRRLIRLVATAAAAGVAVWASSLTNMQKCRRLIWLVATKALTIGLSKNGKFCMMFFAFVAAATSAKTIQAWPRMRSVLSATTSMILPN
jgi:hypothetical protein